MNMVYGMDLRREPQAPRMRRRRPRPTPRRRQTPRRPWLEHLEARQLLTGITPDVTFGPPDIALADAPGTLAAGSSAGCVFGAAAIISSSADGARPVFAADLDADGDQDPLWGSVAGDAVLWSENDGRGGFGPEHVVATGLDQVNSALAVDMNLDGELDVVAASSRGASRTVWYENQGGGAAFREHPIGTSAWGTVAVAVADVDGDLDPDVLTATLYASQGLVWYENSNGGQTFTLHTVPASYREAHDVFVVDLDRDGDRDLLAAFASGNTVAWYENDGRQVFTEHMISNAAISARAVVAVDVDRDGDLDPVSASYRDDKIAWYENDGHQHFTEHLISTRIDGAYDVVPADPDGDGDWDFVSAAYDGGTVAWHENEGDQNFTLHTIATNLPAANSVFVADMDGNGAPDVLSASGSEGANNSRVAWYANQPALVADAGGPYRGTEGLPLAFDASQSYAAAGGALQYRWDFDADGIWDAPYATDPTATHTWLDDHAGQVTVEVTDGQFTASATAAITVQNAAPTLAGQTLLDEAFASDPLTRGWSSTDPGNVQWDGEGFLRARVDDTTGVARWASSPVFPTVAAESFTLEFDMRPASTSWGTYPGIALTQQGTTANPYADGPLRVEAHWSDAYHNQFLIGQSLAGPTGLLGASPVFDASQWYRHTLTYDAHERTLVWQVVERDSGRLFHTGTYTDIAVGPFNQVAVGYQGVVPVYGSWAEIYADNIRLTSGSRGGVRVTPAVIDEGGAVTLTGAFCDAGQLDTHTATVDWGDGTRSTHPLGAGERTFQATHVYTDDEPSGTSSDCYVIGVEIMDDDGGADYTLGWNDAVYVGLNHPAQEQQSKVLAVATPEPLLVTVNNVPPAVAILGAPASVAAGQPVRLTAAVTDAGSEDAFTYAWAVIRDGQPYAVPAPTDQPAFAFIPGNAGAYQVTLTVADDDGGVAAQTIPLDVTAVAPLEIIVGDHVLRPNCANQEITIRVRGGADVTGLNVRAQLGDGTGALSEPVFRGADFAGGMWEAFPRTTLGGPVGSLEQFLQASVVFNETGRGVPAEGVLLTLRVDTTGFSAGQFDLRLSATEIGADTAFVLAGGVELPALIHNGSITVVAAEVVGQYVFYNRSGFDGNDPAPNANDDHAIATDKPALRPGESATFANYTSYSRGLNGIMVDVDRLPAGAHLTAASFAFHIGNTPDPAGWVSGPAPDSISVRPGAGAGGADRVTLLWPDAAILGCWLEVTVLATAETGLAAPYVFYFGNAPGETGNRPTDASVDGADFAGARGNPRDFLQRATIECVFDFNRDSFVDGTDLAIVRDYATNFVTALQLLDLRGPLATDRVIAPEQLGGAAAKAAAAPPASPVEALAGLLAASVEAVPERAASPARLRHPCDVDGDGQVTTADAWTIIRCLASPGSPPAQAARPAELPAACDVNGDQVCTPLDVLLVLNAIGTDAPPVAEGEARVEAGGAPRGGSTVAPVPAAQPSSEAPLPAFPTPAAQALATTGLLVSAVASPARSAASGDSATPAPTLPGRAATGRAAGLRRGAAEAAGGIAAALAAELDATFEEIAGDIATVWSAGR